MALGDVEGWGGVDPWGGNVGEAIAQGQADIASMGGFGGAGWDNTGMAIDPWGGNVAGAIAQGQADIASMGSFGGAGTSGTFNAPLSGLLFDQTPVAAQVPGLLTDLSKITPDMLGPGLLGPSLSPAPSISMAAAPSMATQGLNPAWSDLMDEIDRSTAHVNERDARSVAGVAMAENRGQGGLGMQSVMNAGMNRATNDWGNFGTSVAGQMTAPGQFAAPYSGPIDANTLDMARQAVAGTLPDLTNGAQSFRADYPAANDTAHRSLEALGSQSMYGHVFSDYASIPTPPERPAEFGPSQMADLYTGGTQDPMVGGPGGLLADTFNPAAPDPAPEMSASAAPAQSWADTLGAYAGSMMDGMRGMGTGIGSALASSWGPTNSIYDRVQEYTEPTGITGPKDYTERAPSYYEAPAPTLDQQMAAARADLASRMEQRGRDVAIGGFAFGEQRPSLAAFADSPTALAAAQGLQGPAYAQAPAPEQSWAGSFLSGLAPSSAQAATTAPQVDAYGFTGLSPATGRGMQEVLDNWSGQYASTPPSIASAAQGYVASAPMPPERPASFDEPAAPASAPRSNAANVPTPPERPADLTSPQAASTGFGWSDVAKYGMPVVGGLVGGPVGALAGAALYNGGSWLAGKIGDGTFGTPGGPPVSDPYAYGSQGDYAMPQGTGLGMGQAAAAAPAAAPAPAPAKKQAIHMPSRNAWLYV